MLITKKSAFTGIMHTCEIPISLAQIENWKSHGMPIQKAMPHLSADQREFLMTGITPEEWADVFGGCDE